MTLSNDERTRFADYLDSAVAEEQELINQMAKQPTPAIDALVKQRLAEVAAMRLVSKRLRRTT